MNYEGDSGIIYGQASSFIQRTLTALDIQAP